MTIGTPVVGSATGTWVNNASPTIVAPTHAAGDLLVVVWFARASCTPTSNPPSGWSSGPGFADANGSIFVYYKFAASSSETMPTITKASITGLTIGAICFAVSGVDTTTPFDVSPGSASTWTNNQTNSGTIAAETTVTDGALAFYVEGRNNDWTTAAAATTGWTQLWAGDSTLGTDGGMSGGYKSIATAGTTGTADVAITGGVSTDDGIGFIFALKPGATPVEIATSAQAETVNRAAAVDKTSDVATAAQSETVGRAAAVDKTSTVDGAASVSVSMAAAIDYGATTVDVDAAASVTNAAAAAIAKSSDVATGARTVTVGTAGAVSKSSDVATAAQSETVGRAADVAKTSGVAAAASTTVSAAGALDVSKGVAAAGSVTVGAAAGLANTSTVAAAATATVGLAAAIDLAAPNLDLAATRGVSVSASAALQVLRDTDLFPTTTAPATAAARRKVGPLQEFATSRVGVGPLSRRRT